MNAEITPQQKLKRALWLTFKASRAVGMGFIHATQANNQTEDSLFEYANPNNEGQVYTDYLCGRMMKTQFSIDDGGGLEILPETPRLDYQSWGHEYRTADAIKRAVEESFSC